MPTNLERFKRDLSKLISLGFDMYDDLLDRIDVLEANEKDDSEDTFEENYQRWYTEASAVLKQLMPDRLPEFSHLYHGDGKRKQINRTTYYIQDWLKGITLSDEPDPLDQQTESLGVISKLLKMQLEIFHSVKRRFESSLFDIAQLVRADLFDSELDAARELAKNGFLRGAGVNPGVILEKHLAQVTGNHNLSSRKQRPTISDFNELLKDAGVLDVPTWRQIQRLGDVRNLCGHNKHREPTNDEVIELIDGVEKLCKTLF